MACEYLGHETHTDAEKNLHVKEFCTATLEACLVDDPLGYVNCTRRTFLMMQSVEPEPKPARRKRIAGIVQDKLL